MGRIYREQGAARSLHNNHEEHAMATTFEIFKGARSANYCTLPTVDVEVLPDVRHCETCGQEISYNVDGYTLGGAWQHATTDWSNPHEPRPQARCRYCHTTEGLTFTHAAYSDETRCARCGGVDGYAIGD